MKILLGCTIIEEAPRLLGGMALANLLYDYWATNVRNLHCWSRYNDTEVPPSWLVMEATSIHPASLKIVDSGAKEEAEEVQSSECRNLLSRRGQEVIREITCIFGQPNQNKLVAHRRKTNVIPESNVTKYKANLARNTQRAGLLHSEEPDTGETHQ